MENSKSPPIFTVSGYRAWKTRVRLWEKFTDIPKDKRAFALAACCVSEIPDIIDNLVISKDKELGSEAGVETLLTALDQYFAKSTEIEVFDKFVELMYSRREPNSDLTQFVTSFRTRFDSVSAHELNLQAVCSMVLLANGGFTPQELALVKSVLLKGDGSIKDLKVEETCRVVRTLLVDSISKSESLTTSMVKSEGVNYVGHKGYGKGNRFGSNRNSYGSGNYYSGSYRNDFSYGKRHSGKKGKGKSYQNYDKQHGYGYGGKSHDGLKGYGKGGKNWNPVNNVTTNTSVDKATSSTNE